jgi:hypothetical protein
MAKAGLVPVVAVLTQVHAKGVTAVSNPLEAVN